MNIDHHPDNFIATEPLAAGSRKRRMRVWVWCVLAILAVALGVALWLRYFNPYVMDAKVAGYVTNVERRGILFKTYEGEMISEASLVDTTKIYQRDFMFSVENTSLARRLQSLQSTGRPVRLTYKRYYAPVPWRGASTVVVTAIDEPSVHPKR